jgi:hypothetical protein
LQTLIDSKQTSTVLNIVTTYAWTGSAYVVPSATAKAGCNDSKSCCRMGKIWNARTPLHLTFPTKGAWDRLMPGDLAEKFDMAKVPLQRVETIRISQFSSLYGF